jgi:uncharacterized protein
MKYILTLFAILLAIFLIKKQLRSSSKSKEIDEREDAPTPLSPRQPMGAVPMVACAFCGVYVEKPQALEKNGRHYCCAEHMQADVGGPS